MVLEVNHLEKSEIEKLQTLQVKNLREALTPAMAEKEGFLTFAYSYEEISLMMSSMPQPVLRYKGELVGYALACTPSVCKQIPLLATALPEIQKLDWNGKSMLQTNYYIMGQICIDEKHRGAGGFKMLYDYHKSLFSKIYSCLITEISPLNERSLLAHKHQGFEIVKQYNDGQSPWQIVIWDWQKNNV